MPSSSPVSHVSDTARWVAIYRAMESERPDAIFHDPYARRLGGVQGQAIVDALPKGRKMAWPMIVRTAVMDEMILRAVERDGVTTVLNLAAGLDTRAYRLPLPAACRWIDADLPDILSYKEEQLEGERPRCAYEMARVDLSDATQRRALLQRVDNVDATALVITEGLLVYLTSENVAELAADLHAHPSIRWWLTDLGSPKLLEMMERWWGKQLAQGNAPFRFAPAEGAAFFEPHGWAEVEFRSMLHESVRLNRTIRFGRFWLWLSRRAPKKKREEGRRLSGVVLLASRERGGDRA